MNIRTYIHLNTYITRPVGRCSPPHVVLSWGNSNGQNKSVMHIFLHDWHMRVDTAAEWRDYTVQIRNWYTQGLQSCGQKKSDADGWMRRRRQKVRNMFHFMNRLYCPNMELIHPRIAKLCAKEKSDMQTYGCIYVYIWTGGSSHKKTSCLQIHCALMCNIYQVTAKIVSHKGDLLDYRDGLKGLWLKRCQKHFKCIQTRSPQLITSIK
jgi:hypothetical protein